MFKVCCVMCLKFSHCIHVKVKSKSISKKTAWHRKDVMSLRSVYYLYCIVYTHTYVYVNAFRGIYINVDHRNSKQLLTARIYRICKSTVQNQIFISDIISHLAIKCEKLIFNPSTLLICLYIYFFRIVCIF